MSYWTRTFAAFLMVLTVMLWQPPPVQCQTRAQAQVSRAQIFRNQLAGLQGRIVFLVRHDGSWLQVRIKRVYSILMVVELEDGSQGTIPLASIAAVRDRRPHGPVPSLSSSPSSPPAADAKKPRHRAGPHVFRVEWIGLRIGLGGDWDYGDASLGGFAELTLFTLHWRHFYWEILRVGGGKPHMFHWGTALGYPVHLGDREQHELRIGIHISFWGGTMPSLSGLQIYYQHRPSKKFSIQVGVMQTSYPFSVMGTFGISM